MHTQRGRRGRTEAACPCAPQAEGSTRRSRTNKHRCILCAPRHGRERARIIVWKGREIYTECFWTRASQRCPSELYYAQPRRRGGQALLRTPRSHPPRNRAVPTGVLPRPKSRTPRVRRQARARARRAAPGLNTYPRGRRENSTSSPFCSFLFSVYYCLLRETPRRSPITYFSFIILYRGIF